MQIQRLTGPRKNFELMLSTPNMMLGQSTMCTHVWKRRGEQYTCTVYLEGPREEDDIEENFSRYHTYLPVELVEYTFTDNEDEDLDLLVKVHRFGVSSYLIKEKHLQDIYDRYIKRAAQAYNLEALPAKDTNESNSESQDAGEAI